MVTTSSRYQSQLAKVNKWLLARWQVYYREILINAPSPAHVTNTTSP